MIGLKLKIENKYDTFLGKIFKDIAFENVFWRVVNQEVLVEKGKEFFTKEIYSVSEFENLINLKKYYPVFLTLQLYNQNGKIRDIKNYNNYFDSDCILILYIIDNIFVEIYSKNQDYLKNIKQNALKNNLTNIKNIKDKQEFSLYC